MRSPKRPRYSSKPSPSSSSSNPNSESLIASINDSTAHNDLVWPLPDDVTVKIFSMIDTKSVCNVAAACSFFNKCTRDPLCFANIDLLNNRKVKDAVVSRMIRRAGDAIESIKLGIPPHGKRRGLVDISTISSACLSSLTRNGDAPSLRRLQLYNIRGTANTILLPSLVDLEIVCFYNACFTRSNWKLTLASVSRHCPLLERLVFETSPRDNKDGLMYSTCSEFVLNCPNITTLVLKGFEVPDSMAHALVKGLHKLKYVDFSTSSSLTGSFLKNLGTIGGGNNLEVMILRAVDLSKGKVRQFMEALVAGEWRSLRLFDISHTNYDKRYTLFSSSSSRKQLFEQRPNFCLLAEFGNSDSEESSDEDDYTSSESESEENSDNTSSDESSDEDDY